VKVPAIMIDLNGDSTIHAIKGII